MNSKRQLKRKLGHVVPGNSSSPFDVHVMLNLSINETVCRARTQKQIS